MRVIPIAPLFVPAHKSALVAKADKSGTDAIFLDLEDSVAPQEKDTARGNLAQAKASKPVMVRLNDVRSAFFADDCNALRQAGIRQIILPKCEGANDIEMICRTIADDISVLGMIESIKGLNKLDDSLSHPALSGVIFGNLDFALDGGMRPTKTALLYARSQIVMACCLHDRPAPIDGVTADFSDSALLASDLSHSVEMGFGGKLCIHPAQIAPTFEAFFPSEAQIARAKAIMQAVGDHMIGQLDGQMLDKPVIEAARQIVARAQKRS
ncbi:MAG: HpcH/HpaI aldolase/citrate lyase family protein [Candidatus Puniceispirillaceae bacterium]